MIIRELFISLYLFHFSGVSFDMVDSSDEGFCQILIIAIGLFNLFKRLQQIIVGQLSGRHFIAAAIY